MRKTYNVSFFKNNTYQAHIVESEKSPARIARYYRDVKRANSVIGNSTVQQPKINFKGGSVKWFDDSKLLKVNKA